MSLIFAKRTLNLVKGGHPHRLLALHGQRVDARVGAVGHRVAVLDSPVVVLDRGELFVRYAAVGAGGQGDGHERGDERRKSARHGKLTSLRTDAKCLTTSERRQGDSAYQVQFNVNHEGLVVLKRPKRALAARMHETRCMKQAHCANLETMAKMRAHNRHQRSKSDCWTPPGIGWAMGSGGHEAARRMVAVQERRAALYIGLEEALQAAIKGNSEGMFRDAVTRTAAMFNECTAEVRSLEAHLRSAGDAGVREMADALDRIQALERDKLHCTVTLYTLKRAEAAGVFHWQRPSDDYDPLSPPPNALLAGDSGDDARCHGDHGACSHASLHGHGAAPDAVPAEPTEEEFRGAIAETLRALQDTVEGIRDEMGVVRECLALDGGMG